MQNNDQQNYQFFRLKLLVKMFGHFKFEITNQSLKKHLKYLRQIIRGCDFKSLGTSII